MTESLEALEARLDEILNVGVSNIVNGKSTGFTLDDIIYMPMQQDTISLDERIKQLKDQIKKRRNK